ncbi:ATP-binding cassette domain-containing protein, partial [Vibrio sp. 10N.222.55.C12]
MTQALLHIDNLSVAFGGKNNPRTVTQNVSLSVNKGETLALVGESGSGKSVT